MKFMKWFKKQKHHSNVGFNSIVNRGDIIEISFQGNLEIVQVVNVSIGLNNNRILPTEIVISFIFGVVSENLEIVYTMDMTQAQFKYVKHIRYGVDKRN